MFDYSDERDLRDFLERKLKIQTTAQMDKDGNLVITTKLLMTNLIGTNDTISQSITKVDIK